MAHVALQPGEFAAGVDVKEVVLPLRADLHGHVVVPAEPQRIGSNGDIKNLYFQLRSRAVGAGEEAAFLPKRVDVAVELQQHGGGGSRWQQWKQQEEADGRCPPPGSRHGNEKALAQTDQWLVSLSLMEVLSFLGWRAAMQTDERYL